MEYKILESNGTEIENIDDAAFNNFLSSGKNGIVPGVLNGCQVQNTTSLTLTMSSGLILIQGFRIKILSPETFSVTALGTESNRYLVASLTLLSDRTVSFSMSIRASSSLKQDNLFQSEQGTYEIEIARFLLGSSGIKNFTQTITNL